MKKILAIITMLLALSFNVQAASLLLSWNANTEDDLAGYKVYYGTAEDKLTSVVDVKNVTSYSFIVSPTTTTTYYAALTAYDTSGNESVKSEIISVTVTVADVVPPAKPTGFKAILQKLTEWFKKKFRA